MRAVDLETAEGIVTGTGVLIEVIADFIVELKLVTGAARLQIETVVNRRRLRQQA